MSAVHAAHDSNSCNHKQSIFAITPIAFHLDYDSRQPLLAFWRTPHAFLGGVGAGKTFAGAMAILRAPASVSTAVAPTADMTGEPYKALTIAGPLVQEGRRGTGDRYKLLRTGQIHFRSTDYPERLCGHKLGWFWFDEATQLPDEDVCMIMIGRLRLKPGRGWSP